MKWASREPRRKWANPQHHREGHRESKDGGAMPSVALSGNARRCDLRETDSTSSDAKRIMQECNACVGIFRFIA